ncbi:cystatin-like fold lipoprotein [Staphylococcus aureus]
MYKEQNQMNKIASKYKTLLKQTLNKKTVIHMFIKMVKSLLLVFNYIKIVKMYYFAYEIKDGKAEINREIDPIKGY